MGTGPDMPLPLAALASLCIMLHNDAHALFC